MEGDANRVGGCTICYSPEAKSKDLGQDLCSNPGLCCAALYNGDHRCLPNPGTVIYKLCDVGPDYLSLPQSAHL